MRLNERRDASLSPTKTNKTVAHEHSHHEHAFRARRNEIRWVSSLVGDLPEPMLSVRMCQLCKKIVPKWLRLGDNGD